MTVDKSKDRVRRMFGEIAGRYDLLNHLLSLNCDRYWRWRTVRRVPPDREEPLLDLCSGTGDLALAYVKASNEKTMVVAADFCHEMLRLAVQKSRRLGTHERMAFVEADAQRLPFPADYFQMVAVAFGLRNVADTDKGLSEMTRVCVPGGKIVVLEFSLPTTQPWRAIYGYYFRRVLPHIGQFLSRNRYSAYNYLPASVNDFFSGEALAQRMRAVGLRDVRFYPMTLGVTTLYVGTK